MLFLYSGPFSGINDSLVRAWRAGSPEVEIIPHDLKDIVWGRLFNKLLSVPTVCRRGGLRTLLEGSGRRWDAAKRSAWYMDRLEKAVNRIQQSEEYDFSLATGTIIPMNVPRKPHFIYTDHTILTNKHYPQGQHYSRLWEEALPYERRTIQQVSKIFTMSEHVTQTLLEDYKLDASKVECVGGGWNVRLREPPAADRFERRNVVFVGVDWERKGGPQLMEAFGRIRQRLPDATLTVVGCSPSVSAPGVDIVGPVPADQVSTYLARASVFAMPSRREPFGVAYLEAMRAGLPVVALNLGAVPDFVIDGETGYKVEWGDVEALAQRIETLLTDPDECRLMGQRAQALVESRYSWERAQQAMWAAIQKVLS